MDLYVLNEIDEANPFFLCDIPRFLVFQYLGFCCVTPGIGCFFGHLQLVAKASEASVLYNHAFCFIRRFKTCPLICLRLILASFILLPE
ncbi:MAG: hypothetical protein RL571_2585 [Pseudomonadota bacterium]|jgi:hypothetical protein